MSKTNPPSPGDEWIRVRIPPEFKLGVDGIAERCDWAVRPTKDEEWFDVALRARAEGSEDDLIKVDRAIGAAGASLVGWERNFLWSGQDSFMMPESRQLLMDKAQQLYAKSERVASWEGLDLLLLAALDRELPQLLREVFPPIAQKLPQSSLWALTVAHAVHSRRAATRALLASEAAPELLTRGSESMSGFDAGKGLGMQDGLSIGPLIDIGLLAPAPGVLGISTARLPGIVVLLFGQFEAGRDPAGDPTELIELFRPRLLSTPHTSPLPFPKVASADHEEFFRWWATHVNGLLSISLDPARFRKPNGSLNPALQYGFQLSLDRLVTTIKGILVASRRDEFTRSILAFQALDLLKGLRLGGYESLADPKVVRASLETLKSTLPPAVRSFVIPRCERAVSALEAMPTGFYLTERLSEESISVRDKGGNPLAISLHGAVADYINLVRDAGHTWAEKLSNPRSLSLFIAHNGNIPPDLADLPYLHFLRLVADPTQLAQRLPR